MKITRPYKELISEMITLITFISFVIIYYKIIVYSNIISIISEQIEFINKGLYIVAITIFSAPIVMSIIIIWGFCKETFIILSESLISELEEYSNEEQGSALLMLFIFIGNMIFVAVISFFISYQADSLLRASGPYIEISIRSFLSQK